MRTIAIDFETFYDSEYTLKGSTYDSYVRDERFNPYLISVSDGEETWAGNPADFNFDSLEGAQLIAHNATFDRAVFEEAQRRGMFPKVTPAAWRCTLQGLSYLWRSSPSLKDSVERYYGVQISKEARDAAKGKTSDYSQTMLDYAADDARWAHRLWAEKVAPYWPAQEQRLAELTERQGNRGMKVNRPLLEQYCELLERAIHANMTVLPWYPDRAPASPKGLAEECRKVGIPCPPAKTDDEEGYQDWEDTWKGMYPWVLAIGRQRSLTKMLAKFKTILDGLRPDDVFGFQLRYFGAHTGRWSGDKVNMQNMRRSPLLLTDTLMVIEGAQERDALKYNTDSKGKWPEYVAHVIDERSIWIAREGHKLVIADLSQIEPRVLNWLVDNRDLLDLLQRDPEESVYEAFARGVMGYAGKGKLKKVDPKLYSLFKAMVLGLGYGCGVDKFISVAEAMAGLIISAEESEDAVTKFRDANPLICGDHGLWRKLDTGLRGAVGGNYTIELPNGRTMRYEDVRRSPRPPKLNKETGELESKGWQYTALVNGRRVGTYGGKLTENLVQAVARDVFADGMLKVNDSVCPVLFTAHDELIGEAPEENAEECLKESIALLRQVPDWAAGLPTNAEGLTSSVYVK